MKTIMLVCSAGMSTSLLVTKMEKAAEAQGIEAKIFAVAEAEAANHLDEIDVFITWTTSTFLRRKHEEKIRAKRYSISCY